MQRNATNLCVCRSVKQLNNAVVSHLIEKGVNAVAISPCFNVPGLMAHGGDEYNGATLLVQSIRQTLSAGLVPVIHGDVGLYGKYRDPGAGADPSASTTSAHRCDHFQSMSGGILGGDTLVKIIATHPLMDGCISKAVFLTDVDGVFTKDPKLFPEDAVLMRNIFIDPVSGERMNINTNTNVNTNTNEVLSASSGSSSHEHDVVTGGLEVCTVRHACMHCLIVVF